MPIPDWRDYPEPGLPRVLQAALECFVEKGYDGTSIRDIADGAGLSVAGLYHHYRSKQQILVDLMAAVMDDLLERSQAALASVGPAPRERFDALVECLLRFHMVRREQAFVAGSEIRSLESAHRERYVARRDEQQRMIDGVVEEGIRSGDFAPVYPAEAGRAVATLCVGVSAWYRADGPLGADELVERHLLLARRLVGDLRDEDHIGR